MHRGYSKRVSVSEFVKMLLFSKYIKFEIDSTILLLEIKQHSSTLQFVSDISKTVAVKLMDYKRLLNVKYTYIESNLLYIKKLYLTLKARNDIR